jgi:hypothetical protein
MENDVKPQDQLPQEPPAAEPQNQDDPIITARLEAATATAKAEAYKEALVLGRQDPATQAAPVQQQQLPENALDLLNPAQREALKAQWITDPESASATVASLSAKLERARIEQQAAPLVSSQAATFMELYVMRKRGEDSPELCKAIEPLFRQKMIAAGDLRPLVGMTQQQRDEQFDLRWGSAKAEVLTKQMSAAPPKPEPRLLANSGGGGGNEPPKNALFEEDDWMKAMAKEYGFTPEQMQAIEKGAA